MADDQHQVITDNQIISLHTKDGAQLYQFRPEDQAQFNWGREQNNVSSLDLSAPPLGDSDRYTDVHPWLHWCSVWDGDRDVLLWRGPVFKSETNKAGLQLTCKDSNVYLSRTRCPITKRWEAADPSWIAEALWRGMIDRQGLNIAPISLIDPENDRFDFGCVADEAMLDATVKELIDFGLVYTDVSGTPILGPAPRNIVATLGESDFIGGGISIVRDGSQTFNDLVVRAPGEEIRDRVDLAGANLETIVTIDQVSSVSNVRRAARAYLKQTSVVRADLDLPSGSTLHPSAPVHIDDLIPSSRFWLGAMGLQQLMELESVDVERTPDSATVKVTMKQVIATPELTEGAPTQTLGGKQLLPGQTS